MRRSSKSSKFVLSPDREDREDRERRGPAVSRRRMLVVAAGAGLGVPLGACRPDLRPPTGPVPGWEGGASGTGAGTGGRPGTGGAGSGQRAGAGGGGGSAGGAPGTGAGGAGGGSVDAAGEARGADRDIREAGTDADARDGLIEGGARPELDAAEMDLASASCRPTTRDELGPYYLPGAPFRSVMASPLDGPVLVVTGRVLDSGCHPLAGAELDVWSANGRGDYSERRDGWGRGKIRADAQGHYRFETVLPGAYLGRPRHLHFIVAQPFHADLVTQMYFKGERPDIDSLAVTRTQVGGVWQCTFDIVLRAA